MLEQVSRDVMQLIDQSAYQVVAAGPLEEGCVAVAALACVLCHPQVVGVAVGAVGLTPALVLELFFELALELVLKPEMSRGMQNV